MNCKESEQGDVCFVINTFGVRYNGLFENVYNPLCMQTVFQKQKSMIVNAHNRLVCNPIALLFNHFRVIRNICLNIVDTLHIRPLTVSGSK